MNNIESFLNLNDYKYKKAEKVELDTSYEEFLVNSKIPALIKEAEIFCVGVCENSVNKIIEQVRKRKLYFNIYHDIKDLNELKETALYCFWLLKLQPFFWKGACENKPNYELNAKVALRFFTRGLKFYVTEMNKKSERENLSSKFYVYFTGSVIKNLYYSFRFRDWSKEALMDLAESLVVETQAIPST
jgi:hypothetical protein